MCPMGTPHQLTEHFNSLSLILSLQLTVFQMIPLFKIKTPQRYPKGIVQTKEQCLWTSERMRKHSSRVISSRNACLSRVEGVTARLPCTHKKPPDMVGSPHGQYLLLRKLFPGRIPLGRYWCNFVCKAWFLSIFNIKLLLS